MSAAAFGFTSRVPSNGLPKDGRRLSATSVGVRSAIPMEIQPPSELLDHGLTAEILHDCARSRDLLQGKRIHSLLIASGQDDDTHLGNLLITMYGKCRTVREARAVFEKLVERNLRTWNVMISAYAQNGYLKEAVGLFKEMAQEGIQPDNFTFSAVLSAYTKLMDISEGRKVHELIVSLGFLADLVIATGLVNFYGKCGSLKDAREVFDRSVGGTGDPDASVGLWTSMIAAYIDHSRNWEAIQVYETMLLEGVRPNSQTYVTILNACAALGALKQGKGVHVGVASEGLETNDTIVATALITMYGRCGSLEESKKCFERLEEKDVISWNAMLAAYSQNHGDGCEAFKFFQRMQLEGVKPDKFTLTTLIVSLTTLAQVEFMNKILTESCFEQDLFLSNTLVTMFGKHGCVDGATNTFDRMQKRDVISWTSLMDALVQNGFFLRALQLFHRMNQEGFKPNEVTFVSALDACLGLGDLRQGKAVHEAIDGSFVKMDCFLETAIVNMYGKCGSLASAREVFERMSETDIVTWTSIIGSHAQHGKGKQAMDFFHRMEAEGLLPNAVTFVIFITACSHAGLIEEALVYFGSMTSDYSIVPEAQHCLCIIDLLARSGRLEDAEKFIETMPFRPDAVAWTTLLAACKVTGETQRAAEAAKDLLKSEVQESEGMESCSSRSVSEELLK